MITKQQIKNFDKNSKYLLPYKTLKTPDVVNHLRKFVVQGEKSIVRLLKSPCSIESILCSERFYEKISPWLKDRKEEIMVFEGTSEEVRSVIGYQMYQEVMAVAQIPKTNSLESVMLTAKKPWFFVAVDGLSNAENMGTLIRNCSGFGVTGLIYDKSSCSPFLRRSVRCTMGTIFNIPIIEVCELGAALRKLREKQVTIFGSFPHRAQKVLSDAPFKKDCCLLFGSEGKGMSDSITSQCDFSVTIPMHSGTDSLNVASASAVFLYEVCRQRGIT